MSATATLGIERGGRQGREAPGIPGCHPRSRPRVPRLLPPPQAAASARETKRSGADEREGEEGAPRPRAHPPWSSASPPTQAGRAAPKTPHQPGYPRTPRPSGPGSFWKWIIVVHSQSPRPPSSGQRETHPRGSPGRPARLGQRGTAKRNGSPTGGARRELDPDVRK